MQLEWLVYPGMFNLDSVPEQLKDYAFAGRTIKKKKEEMKEKLRFLAKHNDLQSQAIAAALHRARDISRMPDDGGESDLMGNI